MVMDTRKTHGRQNLPQRVHAAIVLLGLAIAAFVAVAFVIHALSGTDSASASAQETPKISAPAVTGPGTTAATAAPEIGYFPNRYRNQATTIEEPSPTF
jgi:hypothetical protein